METRQVKDLDRGVFSFGSMTLIVGALGLALLLFWGWRTGQDLPLWPALLVAGVNVVGALKLLHETRTRQAAARQRAAAPTAPPAADTPPSGDARKRRPSR